MRVDDYCRDVIRAGKLTSAQQAVLWMHASYVNHRTGDTIVSVQTIADDCHIHCDNVGRHRAALTAAGVWRVTPRAGRTSVISFPIHDTADGYLTTREIAGGQLSTPPAKSRVVAAADPPRNRRTPPAKSSATPRDIAGLTPIEPQLEPAARADADDGPIPAWMTDHVNRHRHPSTIAAETTEPTPPLVARIRGRPVIDVPAAVLDDQPPPPMPRMMWEADWDGAAGAQ
jgi:hypothetical protein